MESVELFNMFLGLFLGIVSFFALLIGAYKMAAAPLQALRDVKVALTADAERQDKEIEELNRKADEAKEAQGRMAGRISEIHTNVQLIKQKVE